MRYLFNEDCRDILHGANLQNLIGDKFPVIVTDPPFNINYHYKSYKDNLKENDYLNLVGG